MKNTKGNMKIYLRRTALTAIACMGLATLTSAANAEVEMQPATGSEISISQNPKGKSGFNFPVKSTTPTENIMLYDITGQRIGEGQDKGYMPEGWRLKLDKGSVNNFRIDKVLKNDTKNYTALVSFTTKGGYYGYAVTAKIAYVKTEGLWKFNKLTTENVMPLSDGKYNDDISCLIEDEEWGGTYGLSIGNSSDETLRVGGRILTNGKWKKFGVSIDAHSTVSVGGEMQGEKVDGYEIDFVVKE